jgi:hypothetical protein
MATYIQGVTDYIPQFQPFEPDYNFYQNIMQTKQSQYDSNWKALNNMYSEYYNADLTREPNIKKRDTYLKDIEFNLKRVSQLDLSLEQNVNQASQVFKPFYEDSGLMRDMALTKKAKMQIAAGEGYQNSFNKDIENKYWPEGIAKIKFELQEFKEASDEEAASFQIDNYVKNVNTYGIAEKIAKDFGNVQFAPEWKNGYIITTTNGAKLVEPLSKLFEASLGNDPAVIEKYKAQAYVDRKTYAEANASQFGGDKIKAENKYLQDSFTILKSKVLYNYKIEEEKNKAYDARMLDVEKQVKNGTAGPDAKLALEQYKINKDINDKNLALSKKNVEFLNNGNSTAITTTDFVNPYKDLKSLRYKVDNGMASLLLNKDLDQFAQTFALRGQKFDVKTDPYAMAKVKYGYDSSLVSQRNAGTQRAARTLAKSTIDAANIKKQSEYDSYLLNTGQAYMIKETDKYGNITTKVVLRNDADQNKKITTDGQSATGPLNQYEELQKRAKTMNKDQQAILTSTIDLMQNLIEAGTLSKYEAGIILGSEKKPINFDVYKARIEEDNKKGAYTFMASRGGKELNEMSEKFKNFIAENSQLSSLYGNKKADDFFLNSQKYDEYEFASNYIKKERINIAAKIVNATKGAYPHMEYYFDENGYKRSEEDFNNVLREYGIVQKDVRGLGQRALDAINPFASVYDDLNYGEYAVLAKRADEIAKDETFMGKGTGSNIDYINETTINPYSEYGMKTLDNIFSDLQKFSKTNPKDKFSTTGAFGEDYDKEDPNLVRITKGANFLNKLRADFKNPKETGLTGLDVRSFFQAAERNGIGAYTFMLPNAYIDKNTQKTDAKGNITTTGYFSIQEAQDIKQHGITYFTAQENLNSKVMESYRPKAFVDAISNDNPYVYKDMLDPNNTFTITPGSLGISDYEINGTISLFDPVKGRNVPVSFHETNSTYGTGLIEVKDKLINELFPDARNDNKVNFNDYESIEFGN